MEEPIVIQNRNGKRLIGILHTPDSCSSGPMVVFAHGFQGTKSAPHRIFTKMARKLASHGIAALRFDYFGSGDSEGEFCESTISSQIADLEDVFSSVFHVNRFNVTNYGLIGYSLGGCIASIAQSKLPMEISSIVLWAPVSNPYWNLIHLLGEDRVVNGLVGKPVYFDGEQIGTPFFEELLELHPLECIKKYENPVLIIHGEQDQDVLLSNGIAYKEAVQHPLSQLKAYSESGHLFNDQEGESALLTQTLEWFKEYLLKKY
ncbi:alpha/beta hydrolase family protein [Bacillus timonensis]|uniref:alpha/beta hydrolase family protein n=1 Tax=Bacillus timonensis TaxID=1033734 RepID=UPI000289CF70|nr:alpha/beta hydrolase [Bacillus timonensis]